ncbi:MAG TPA: phosphoglycerate mutase family protein [Candidatus Binatia bacterium]|nr:phosphoglycerate mutase family protein [Candidatus Binatia bacterium]
MRKQIVISFLALFVFLPCPTIQAQQVIFLVRHAEQSGESDDPELTEVGKRRAKALASMLRDAGINAIFTTERSRAIQTAEPVARSLNVQTKRLPVRDLDGLIARVRTEHTQDRVLIVSHSLVLPRLLKALGHPAEVTIAPNEYDNVFVIIPNRGDSPMMLRLRY